MGLAVVVPGAAVVGIGVVVLGAAVVELPGAAVVVVDVLVGVVVVVVLTIVGGGPNPVTTPELSHPVIMGATWLGSVGMINVSGELIKVLPEEKSQSRKYPRVPR